MILLQNIVLLKIKLDGKININLDKNYKYKLNNLFLFQKTLKNTSASNNDVFQFSSINNIFNLNVNNLNIKVDEINNSFLTNINNINLNSKLINSTLSSTLVTTTFTQDVCKKAFNSHIIDSSSFNISGLNLTNTQKRFKLSTYT